MPKIDDLMLLEQMRDELVQKRRMNARDNNLSGVIEAQRQLQLIDRAIEDEGRLRRERNDDGELIEL